MSLERLVSGIQQRFGYGALRRASELTQLRRTLATGLTPLDAMLDGGLLQGAAHQIIGQPTSGATSLLYHALANLQGQGLPVVYMDMAGLFDPPNAAAAGLRIERLLLLRETDPQHALFLIHYLAQRQLPCLLALDQPAALPLTQLKPVLRDAPLTLLVLAAPPLAGMQVVLRCQWQAWDFDNGDVCAFRSDLRLLAHPFLPFRQCSLRFTIPREETCV